ncbi:glycosyl hydrolase family 28 protein [Hamadaea tsunoensis]|uniref:glycosyl hydrolase family 28 protein n=1 Tax=Hamadaea tsunoensis TaxID=53368 RepID=UPI000428D9EE|nr:glycosyl hydrolase family 28 protein [Hamadaea tsunoensis]
MRIRRLTATVLTVATGILTIGSAGMPAYAATFNVRNYGATGNGSTNDSAAIQAAIDAAASAGGGIVQFPAGTYKSANTIHLKSNITVQLDAGSTVVGSSADTYDPPEANPYDAYQDYGHSHFHDAMFYGDRLTNLAFTGSGTLDGGGNLITGNPASGEADKILSLTRCTGLTLNGITLRRGGHFAILTNNCNDITSDQLKIFTSSDRDAWNIISATNVTITNADINGNDDAIVFKSDYALGAKLPNGHVRVSDSHVSAGCCNAVMFGSETCGDFTDYVFERLNITSADKSGLGMVSMDGANISDVHYRDITMTGVASPIMQKIGTRKRCGNSPGVGHISNVTYENITATGKSSPQFAPTLWGEAGSNQITNVSFTNVHITVPGGSSAVSTAVPTNDPTNYNPNSIGTRPAYGWYIHNAANVTFTDSSVEFAANDNRPAVIANTGSSVRFTNFTAEKGSGSASDALFQTVAGYCVTGQNTTGGALRVSASGSTVSCPPPVIETHALEAESGTVTAPMQIGTDPAAWGSRYVAAAAGSNSTAGAPTSGWATVPFSVTHAGTYKIMGRVIAPTTSDDSFWVRVDNGPWTDWNDIDPGAAWHWADVTDDANANALVTRSLTAGAHTLTIAYREDGAKLDRLLVTNDLALVPANDPPPAGTRYEAEDAVLSQGAVEANHLGFSGTGFVNTDNVAGAYVEWTVTASTAGPATVRIAYANGTTTARPSDVTVNGTLVAGPTFDPTANWDTWASVAIPVTLSAGSNTIRITASTAGGCPNLDYAEI